MLYLSGQPSYPRVRNPGGVLSTTLATRTNEGHRLSTASRRWFIRNCWDDLANLVIYIVDNKNTIKK